MHRSLIPASLIPASLIPASLIMILLAPGAGAGQDAGPGTDFHAIREGYVSITPVKVDMTHYDTFQSLSDWLKDGL